MHKPRYVSWLIVLALLVTALLPAPSQADTPCPGTYAPGVVLVRLHQDHHTSRFTHHVLRPLQHAVITSIPNIGVTALHVPIGRECDALEALRRDPRIAFAELDYAVHATDVFTPNDPGWANQWGPDRIGAPAAWGVTTGTPDVVIAVLDSGTQLGHTDLAGNRWSNPGETPDNGVDDDGNGKVDDFWGWRFYHVWDEQTRTYVPREDNQVADDLGHGTHVAGIAAAQINNGVGIAGMAGGSRLMTVKVVDQFDRGWYSDIAQGIVYAVNNGAQIINLSLGGEPSSQTLQEAANYAHARGVLVVASTGNDGGDVLYPAACQHVLAVAATDQDDDRPGFSNHGPQVDVAAPGTDIYSTWYRGNYFTKSGTSMAAPHVSGLAALIWSARPDLNAAQVTRIITSTAVDVNGVGTGLFPGWDEFVGWGRIQAAQALSATMLTPRPQYLPMILQGNSRQIR